MNTQRTYAFHDSIGNHSTFASDVILRELVISSSRGLNGGYLVPPYLRAFKGRHTDARLRYVLQSLHSPSSDTE